MHNETVQAVTRSSRTKNRKRLRKRKVPSNLAGGQSHLQKRMWIRSHYRMVDDKDTGLSQNQVIVETVAGYCFWNGIIRKSGTSHCQAKLETARVIVVHSPIPRWLWSISSIELFCKNALVMEHSFDGNAGPTTVRS